MAVLGHEALKDFLSRADVAKDARHFTALRDGRIDAGFGRYGPSPRYGA